MSSTTQDKQGSILLAMGGGALLVGGMLITGHFVQVQDASAGAGSEIARPTPLTVVPEHKPSADDAQIGEATARYLAADVAVTLGDTTVTMKRAELGLVADPASYSRARLNGADFQGLVPVAVDRSRGEAALAAITEAHARPATNAYMDLENRKIVPSRPGWGLDVSASMSNIETAGRTGAPTVELVGAEYPADVTVADLGIDDISTVLSSFTTRFSVNEKSRNTNLKLLASHMDGRVLQPGELFSFNEISGDRTLDEGYKMAHVILAGEMVDGEAGGSCQISTTLHGASFFSGLEIVNSLPHSRPSTYVTMGLDATVVYPTTDLKLRNPFDFPVVIHFTVARGQSTVEILGKEKPYDKITFEREITKRIPFDTVTREDDTIPVGHLVIDQSGYPGYRVERRRLYHKGKKVVKQDKWTLNYRPVVEYVRIGTNPDPNLPPPKQKNPHGPKPASGTFRMSQ